MLKKCGCDGCYYDEKKECLHCEKNEAAYCESCYQDLITENARIQYRILALEKNLENEIKDIDGLLAWNKEVGNASTTEKLETKKEYCLEMLENVKYITRNICKNEKWQITRSS